MIKTNQDGVTKGDTLILLTESYPYGNGETFLTLELVYLASRFNQIVLVPETVQGSARPVPEGVVVETQPAELFHAIGTIGRGARALSCCLMDTGFYRELFSNSKSTLNPIALRQLVLQTWVGRRIVDWLESFISREQLSSESTLFYSYWNHTQGLALALLKQRFPEVRVVSRAHRFDLYWEHHRVPYIPYYGFKLSSLDAVYPISEHGRDYMLVKYPDGASRIQVRRLGVTRQSNRNPRPENKAINIVSCSFISKVKRIDLLIDALSRLGEECGDRIVTWNHIGSGPLFDRLQREARSQLSKIEWTFRGHLNAEEVMEFYSKEPVDLFVNVSDSEGIPVSIMEAQSFGVPVLARAVGGIPEIVNAGNGILLKEDASAEDIAVGLRNFCQLPPAEVQGLREGALNHWREFYDGDKNYSAFADELVELTQRRVHLGSGKPS